MNSHDEPSEYAPERPLRDKIILVLACILLGAIALIARERVFVPWIRAATDSCPTSSYFGRPCLEVFPYAVFVGVPLIALLPMLLLVWRGCRIVASGQIPPPGEKVLRRTRIRRGRYAVLAGAAHFVPAMLLVCLAVWGTVQAGRWPAHRESGAAMEDVDRRSDARTRFIPASRAQVFAAMREPARVARWWGPAGFTNTIHEYEFVPGGRWLLTMHGPDGKDYPNESRFLRIDPDKLFEIEHLNGHHFVLTLELHAQGEGTMVHWRQTFDTAEHYERLAEFVAAANEQNLARLAAEVMRGQADPGGARERDLS